MANNRLWAVCKDDNEATCLAKCYGNWAGGFQSDDKFYDKHENCSSNKGGGENIIWVTEVDDDRVEKYDFTRENGQGIKIYFKKTTPLTT